MNHLRNAIALIVGLAIGGGVNMAIILVGPAIIPPPEGVDVTSMESISESLYLYELKMPLKRPSGTKGWVLKWMVNIDLRPVCRFICS